MSIKTNTGLVEYAKAQLGRPYWMGTFGQIATENLYSYNKKRLPSDYLWADMPTQFGQRVHDCIGLVKGYLWSDGPNNPPQYLAQPCTVDYSADDMRAACKEKGAVDTIPEIPGILVFKSGHVGVYLGNGEVIEARGHRYGVVQTKLAARPWTYWGKCPCITYEENDDMTQDKFEEMYEEMLAKKRAEAVPEWAEAEYQKAIDAGITDGTRPMEPIPRYQAAIMALRARQE